MRKLLFLTIVLAGCCCGYSREHMDAWEEGLAHGYKMARLELSEQEKVHCSAHAMMMRLCRERWRQEKAKDEESGYLLQRQWYKHGQLQLIDHCYFTLKRTSMLTGCYFVLPGTGDLVVTVKSVKEGKTYDGKAMIRLDVEDKK